MTYTDQYMGVVKEIVTNGTVIANERTNTNCHTVLNKTFTYSEFPLFTLRKINIKGAIAEMLGYLKGLTNAKDFEELGTKTWIANSENPMWTSNPNYKGKYDMGKVYGAIARDFGGINLIQQAYINLKAGVDTRGEIITFWKPDDFDKGCLRPCMYSHQFSLLGDTLYLTSMSRSVDLLLGQVYNSIQCWFLLTLMAHLTGYKVGTVTHHMVNVHIYENQLEAARELLDRYDDIEYCSVLRKPQIAIMSHIKDIYDVDNMTLEDIKITNPNDHLPVMKIPFTV